MRVIELTFGTIAEGSGQPRGDCPYRMGQGAKVQCTRILWDRLRDLSEVGRTQEPRP